MMKTKKHMLAVLAIFFMLITSSATAVVLQSIRESFPEASIGSVYLILSLPTVFTMITSVISGQLTSKNVKYKTMAVMGLSLTTVTGVLPFFLNSVPAILVSRAVFGIGIGMINPMGNTLAVLYFGPETGGKVIGYGNTSMDLGNILLQITGGILAGISWRYSFLVYLFGLIPLVIIAVTLEEPKTQMEDTKMGKERLPMKIYILSIFLLAAQALIYPLYLNMSILIQTGISGGNPSSSGLALGVAGASGMLVGIFFEKIKKIFERFTLTIALLIGALGLYIINVSVTIPVLLVGCVLCGACNTT